VACSLTRQPKLRERRDRATLVVNSRKRTRRRLSSSAKIGSSALAWWRSVRRPGGAEGGLFADLTTKVARGARPRNFVCQRSEEDSSVADQQREIGIPVECWTRQGACCVSGRQVRALGPGVWARVDSVEWAASSLESTRWREPGSVRRALNAIAGHGLGLGFGPRVARSGSPMSGAVGIPPSRPERRGEHQAVRSRPRRAQSDQSTAVRVMPIGELRRGRARHHAASVAARQRISPSRRP
jgi:hypothetical protein